MDVIKSVQVSTHSPFGFGLNSKSQQGGMPMLRFNITQKGESLWCMTRLWSNYTEAVILKGSSVLEARRSSIARPSLCLTISPSIHLSFTSPILKLSLRLKGQVINKGRLNLL